VPWAKPSQFAESFWTPECTEAVHYARQLRRTRPDSQEYREAVKHKRKVVRTAKTLSFRTKIHEATEDTKGIWRLAKWARTRGHIPAPIPQFPDLTTPQGIATTFQDKVQALQRRFFLTPPEPDLSDLEGCDYPEPFVQEQITIDDVKQAIKAPRPLKALGLSGIPHLIIQESLEITALALTALFQACIDQGYHPKEFKQARTIALQKPGKADYTLPENYRPIALLECLGKALERVVAAKLTTLAETYELLPQYQMGGRRQRNTLTALELLTEQTHTIWNCGNQWVASLLSLDISGAYDNAAHPRLLHNLRRLRVPTWIVRWTQSFLQDRMTTIKLQSEETELFLVYYRIPQGSPILPILYLFYNEELVRECNSIGYRASAAGFMDDVNILV